MTKCTKILLTAVMGMSLSTAAWAQQTPAEPAAGPDVVNPTAVEGDALGAPDSMQSHDITKSASDADAKMAAQLDKIATMPATAGDALFAFANANGNLFEIEAAKLAETKSENPKVKELAMMIEKDHAEANAKLKPIVEKMGLEFPTALPTEKVKMLAIAAAQSPADFDTCYVLNNKAMHAKDITAFSDHAKATKDDELKAYIEAVLPKLKEHGMHVNMLAAEMGYPSMGGGMGHKMDHDMGDTDKSDPNKPAGPKSNQSPNHP